MADGIPFQNPANDLTGHCTAAVVGQHFVAVSATQQADGPYSVATAGAGVDVLGVAMRDGAVADRILIETRGVQPVVVGAGGPLTAGQPVMSDAVGCAVPWVWAANGANVKAGICLADTAVGAVAPIKMHR